MSLKDALTGIMYRVEMRQNFAIRIPSMSCRVEGLGFRVHLNQENNLNP